MQHIDEHTLELYVLQDPSVLKKRLAIEIHLKSCTGCRQLVKEMHAVYRRAEGEVQRGEVKSRASRSLVRKAVNLSNVYHESTYAVVREPRGFVDRAWWYVRKYPVSTGMGLTMLVIALVTLMFNWGSLFKSTNPFQARFNVQAGRLEVYDKEGEQLWSLPWYGEHDLPANDPLTIVTDLDGDGSNELVTMRSSLGAAEESRDILKVFDSKANLKFKKKLGKSFTALGKMYDIDFSPSWIFVGKMEQHEQKEIMVGLSHVHSPFVILRLNHQGEEIGEYWHYGHLYSNRLIDFGSDGKKDLVVGGSADVQAGIATSEDEDSLNDWHAVFTILDPTRIVGKTQSSVTQVFGLTLSEAEQYYIALPKTEVNRMFLQKPKIDAVEFTGPKHLTVWSVSGDPPKQEYGSSFEYVFTNDLSVIDVKPSDVTRRLYHQLFKEGRLKNRLDNAYLETLKKGVRYWDGSGWRKEVVGVGTASLVGR